MYSVVLSPNQVLREPTKPVASDLADLTKIIEEMKQTMLSQTDPEGVGLAANQVDIPYRIFIARFSTKKSEPVHVFINPEIVDHSKNFLKEEKETPLEGCLSLPKFYGHVKRYEWVQLRFQTPHFKTQIKKYEGFAATVIQHELDHLNGKIFVERILEQKGQLYRVTGKDKKGKEIWEEVEI